MLLLAILHLWIFGVALSAAIGWFSPLREREIASAYTQRNMQF
jgi:hypothetical protein